METEKNNNQPLNFDVDARISNALDLLHFLNKTNENTLDTYKHLKRKMHSIYEHFFQRLLNSMK